MGACSLFADATEGWAPAHSISLRPTKWGEGAPEGRMRGSFSGKHDGRRGDAPPSSCKASAASRSPPHPPLRGTFFPSKAGEKGKWGTGEKGKSGARSLLFPSPHEVGRRCPGGADEGLFLREARWQTRRRFVAVQSTLRQPKSPSSAPPGAPSPRRRPGRRENGGFNSTS